MNQRNHGENKDNLKKPQTTMERWKGFKECNVIKTVQEDTQVVSFYLGFGDGVVLPDYEPGQFIGVRVKRADGTYTKARQYTLSTDYKKDYYRISVKREEDGNVSKILCDEVHEGDILEITAPAGKFVLRNNERPIVLLGGGIGITPMLTMAYAAVDSKREIHLIYSTPNSDCHSFQDELEELAKASNIKATVFYTRPYEKDEGEYDVKGRISLEWIKENLPRDAEFYFCGPIPFMRSVYLCLTELGIEKEHIHYELFGPGADITKPEN